MPSINFPADLARITAERWSNLVSGDYEAPPSPPTKLLKRLLDAAYVAATMPDEGRYPAFNLVAERGTNHKLLPSWKFEHPRTLTPKEIKRLAPATDLKKSAILIDWDGGDLLIKGIVDLGTSWHRARMGLDYRYRHPLSLFIQADRPGRIRVYQGPYLLSELNDGKINAGGMGMNLFLHGPANSGLARMDAWLVRPQHEYVRDWHEFEFIALWNTYAAIANTISLEGHGGALLIRSDPSHGTGDYVAPKYDCVSNRLRDTFIDYMNKRHIIGDLHTLEEEGEDVSDRYPAAELGLMAAHNELVEATRFVARLAGCDGGIVITDDLRLLGFGSEIRAEMNSECTVHESTDLGSEARDGGKKLDVTEFGMRHRSAVKLASQDPTYTALVISQDGPVSGIWRKDKKVLVRRDVNLVNMNMPWA